MCTTILNVDDHTHSLEGAVYPNPVTGTLFYNFENSFTNDQAEFIMRDVRGEIVLRQIITGISKGKIQLKGIADGIYFGEISCGGNSWRGKIIKVE